MSIIHSIMLKKEIDKILNFNADLHESDTRSNAASGSGATRILETVGGLNTATASRRNGLGGWKDSNPSPVLNYSSPANAVLKSDPA